MAKDTVMIKTSAAPVCGGTGAARVATKMAAVATLRAGYSHFVITGGQSANNVGVVGYTPVQAHTTGSATAYGHGNVAHAYGSSTTTYSGGKPIIAGTHDQGFVVKMLNGGNGVDAKQVLGKDWKELVKNGITTCT